MVMVDMVVGIDIGQGTSGRTGVAEVDGGGSISLTTSMTLTVEVRLYCVQCTCIGFCAGSTFITVMCKLMLQLG